MHPRANSDFEVARLKELLFDEEQRALDHLDELVQRHHARVGTDERLTSSVSVIIADALRQADVKQHRELAAAVSPLVVSGIKREIRNSRDEMVDALYPIMGRLVSAYVKTAVRDMMESTNARLESGLSGRSLRLRAKSLLTGRPYRELMLKEGGRLRILELLLIRRSDGVMVDRWQALQMGDAPDQAADSALLGGMLSAINDFSRDALSGSNDELRSLETGDSRIYLRTSPAYLLAVKCTGAAARRTERAIGQTLLGIIEERGEVLAEADGNERSTAIKSILPAAAERLAETLEAEKGRPILAIALVAGLGLGLAGLLGWHLWHEHRISSMAERVGSAIAAERAFDGYPLSTEVAADLSAVSVSGFAPSDSDAERLIERLRSAVGPAVLKPHLTSVPTIADYRRRTSDLLALSEQLKQVESQLSRVEGDIGSLAARGDVEEIARQLPPLAEQIAGLDQRLAGAADRRTLDSTVQQLQATAASLDGTAKEVERLRSAMFGLAAKETADGLSSDLAGLSSNVKGLSSDVAGVSAKVGSIEERIASLPFAGQLDELSRLTEALRQEVAALSARIDDPRNALLAILERHAVFFETGTTLRSRTAAQSFIADAVTLARRASAGLRVVGYTDATGTPESNQALGNARAGLVADMLVAAGFPRSQIVTVQRAAANRIAPDQAGGAPSERRVELEATFEGELAVSNGAAP